MESMKYKRHTIGLSFTASTVLDLETREVGIGLDLFDEWHLGQWR
jgi:hypothetical protein